MAKRITEKDHVMSFLTTADEGTIRSMLDTAKLVLEIRFPNSATDKPKRGRPPVGKRKPEAAAETKVGAGS